jgi:CMP-N-acetylneuraminic acid synthetase
MPKERSVDIDDRWDFLLAEAILADAAGAHVLRRQP